MADVCLNLFYFSLPEIWLKQLKFCFVVTLRSFLSPFLFRQIAANRNMAKHVCHMVTLKKYLTQNKYLTRMLTKKKETFMYMCIFSYIMDDEYFHVSGIFCEEKWKTTMGSAQKGRMNSKILFLITIKLTYTNVYIFPV